MCATVCCVPDEDAIGGDGTSENGLYVFVVVLNNVAVVLKKEVVVVSTKVEGLVIDISSS